MRYFIILCFIFSFVSCKIEKKGSDGVPVAKVLDNSLMLSEVVAFIPTGTPPDDSILMAKNYIRNWITKQLLLNKATENLTEEEKDIERQVEDYRNILLIHAYKQKLIAQKLTTDIQESMIEKYYQENKNSFILQTPIVKALYFVVPKTASDMDKARKWYLSNNEDDIAQLEEYCITNAKKFDNFDNNWIELKYILNLIPDNSESLEKQILSQKHVEKEEGGDFYFLKIKDIRQEQTIAPLDYVREEIILILKNKLKSEFEDELEYQINEEGIRRNFVKIY